MGNCQAIDNATLVIQHPSGKVDKLYSCVTASEIMKMNPGHYVALLLTTTTLRHPTSSAAAVTTSYTTKTSNVNTNTSNDKNNIPVRITRIKLLRPTDTLVLGHAYRLITAQEVMKGLWAKKYAKMKQQQLPESAEKKGRLTAKEVADIEAAIAKYQMEKINQQAKHERQKSTISPQANSGFAKSRAWHPSLHSISEAGS